MRPHLLLLLALLPAALLLTPAAAHACSCSFPRDLGFLAAQDGALPLNARGILWIGSGPIDPASFRVERLNKAGKATPVPFTLQNLNSLITHVRLTGDPKPGERYRFQTARFNPHNTALQTQPAPRTGKPWQTVTFTVSPDSLDLSTLKPLLEASPVALRSLSLGGGSTCSYKAQAASSDLRVVLPPEAEPFRQHLLFTTLLNGAAPWSPRHNLCDLVAPGRTWTDTPGTDTVYNACFNEHGRRVEPAAPPQDVTIQLSFPQVSDTTVLTPAVHLKLTCPDPLPEAPGPKDPRFP